MNRLALERTVIARLMVEPDPDVLRRHLFGLRVLGLDRGHFSGSLAYVFTAIVVLANRGDQIDEDAIAHETHGRIDRDHLTWLRTAYSNGGETLHGLAVGLLDAERRHFLESVCLVGRNAAWDPGADIDRSITMMVAQLRRAGRRAC